MKKFWVFLLLFLVACSPAKEENYQTIEKPEMNRAPLHGRWIVTNVQYLADDSKDPAAIVGSDAFFSSNVALFHDQRTDYPSYTVRKGSTDYFMKLRYNMTKEQVGITAEKLFVIDVYDGETLLFTVFREKEDIAYIDLYGNLMQLVKTKKGLDDRQVEDLLDGAVPEKKYYSSNPGK